MRNLCNVVIEALRTRCVTLSRLAEQRRAPAGFSESVTPKAIYFTTVDVGNFA